ncbi:hypothetical protein HQN89_30810 [Paenibacillus frigoriresistens]|uniref:hypothetical protein n=1 Tax=Paenibacillus alginolyticus TaxID=59839 RepID=UPI0015647ECA|nr:hypothetical protein [Paenibacillus frigoriresistens]NRF95274.1 hypothetical protein [Paenibacillus frigoriresistens]
MWICGHLVQEHFESHEDQVKHPIEMHDQIIELIEGLTRMQMALAKNLQAVLGQHESDNDTASAGINEVFGSNGRGKG